MYNGGPSNIYKSFIKMFTAAPVHFATAAEAATAVITGRRRTCYAVQLPQNTGTSTEKRTRSDLISAIARLVAALRVAYENTFAFFPKGHAAYTAAQDFERTFSTDLWGSSPIATSALCNRYRDDELPEIFTALIRDVTFCTQLGDDGRRYVVMPHSALVAMRDSGEIDH